MFSLHLQKVHEHHIIIIHAGMKHFFLSFFIKFSKIFWVALQYHYNNVFVW